MIVLDATAAVEWLLVRELAGAVARRFADPDVTLHAPSFLGVEVASALRGLVLGGQLDAVRGATALADLAMTDIAFHDPTPLLPRVWELRDNLSSYDAAYVALAELLGARLVTTDARLAQAPGPLAEVDVVISA